MKQKIKKIWSWVTTVFVILVLILSLLLAGARLFGLQTFFVMTSSMEPEYPVGSLIYVKQVAPTELEDGDVITFMADKDKVATHRIARVIPDEEDPSVLLFKTKGDANKDEDGEPVHQKNVIGTPVFCIPYLGYVSAFIQNPPGLYLAISAGAVLLCLVLLPEVIFDSDKAEEKDKPKAERADN